MAVVYAGAVEIDAGPCRLRPFVHEDIASLVRVANDAQIARNLTHLFPYPYTPQDAADWIELCAREGEPTRNFAIEVDEELAGGIGLDILEGEKAHVARVGYWLAVNFWNRGLATHALRALTEYAFVNFALHRLEATVFGWNPASGRVLEKCGYRLEGRLRDAIAKGNEITDELVYGVISSAPRSAGLG